MNQPKPFVVSLASAVPGALIIVLALASLFSGIAKACGTYPSPVDVSTLIDHESCDHRDWELEAKLGSMGPIFDEGVGTGLDACGGAYYSCYGSYVSPYTLTSSRSMQSEYDYSGGYFIWWNIINREEPTFTQCQSSGSCSGPYTDIQNQCETDSTYETDNNGYDDITNCL